MSKPIDLSLQRFGKWIVIDRDYSKKGKGAYWICVCDCGNVRSVESYQLRNGKSKSCGMCGINKRVPDNDPLLDTIKPFNKEKQYLGKLCKRGHDYENTGKSLRYKSNNRCKLCILIHGRRTYYKDIEKTRAKNRRKYHKQTEKQRERARTLARNRYKKRSLGKNMLSLNLLTTSNSNKKINLIEFDRNKFYLGKLCPRNHDYCNTGLSLRYKGSHCVECQKTQQREYNQRPERKKYMRERARTPEEKKRRKEYRKEYLQRPEAIKKRKQWAKEYSQRIEVKERRNKLKRLRRLKKKHETAQQ